MGKVLAGLGVVFILLIIVLATYFQASRQLGEAWGQCMIDLKFEDRLKTAQSASDISLFLADTVDCVDRRKSLLAGLLFNRQQALDRLQREFRDSANRQAELERQIKEYEDAARDQQNDLEAERNLQEFRQGVYRAGNGK